MGINTYGATGVPLPPPQPLFPVTIANAPQIVGTNQIALGPGGDILLPPGSFLVEPGVYSQVQVLDPVSNVWRPFSQISSHQPTIVNSDGVNYRIVNPTGFPIAAIVTVSGGGYTSVPTVTASVGGSTWLAIVGGGIGSINCLAASSGVNYAAPPIVNISAPPTPGIGATAVCAISGGSISGFSITNPGAGYLVPPTVTIVPQFGDLNANSATVNVTNAKATASVSYGGCITAVLLIDDGNNPLPAAPALTFAGGGGAGAAATAVMALSVTNVTVAAVGSGYPAGPVLITTAGGNLQTQSSGTPATTSGLLPGFNVFPGRAAQIAGLSSGGGSGLVINANTPNSGIVDGGLFTTVPIGIVVANLQSAASGAVVTLTMGGVNDTIFITPL